MRGHGLEASRALLRVAVIAVVIVAGLASRAVAPAVGCSVRCLRDDARVVGAVVVRLAIFPV